jgi:hypothetical protein
MAWPHVTTRCFSSWLWIWSMSLLWNPQTYFRDGFQKWGSMRHRFPNRCAQRSTNENERNGRCFECFECFSSLTHFLSVQALRLRGQLEFPDQRLALSSSLFLWGERLVSKHSIGGWTVLTSQEKRVSKARKGCRMQINWVVLSAYECMTPSWRFMLSGSDGSDCRSQVQREGEGVTCATWATWADGLSTWSTTWPGPWISWRFYAMRCFHFCCLQTWRDSPQHRCKLSGTQTCE